MKNTLIICIVICFIFLVVFLVGLFGNLRERENDELDNGEYTSICTIEYNDGEDTVSTKTTTNYNKNKIDNNMKVDTTYTFEDQNEFEEKIKSLEENSILYEANKDVSYEYKINKKRKTYTITLIYSKIEINKNTRNRYKMDKIVRDSENNDETCDLIGITRRELGV